ncbi:hypothetical protein LJC46_01425 [Desulfovibrio sp. OttesenSCG-928-G15]|nr:hypothetical protein [Desulfovibrio sp. OttesenSCG-928-G15]
MLSYTQHSPASAMATGATGNHPENSYQSIRSALSGLQYLTNELHSYLEAQHDALTASDMESALNAESGIARLSVAIVELQEEVQALLKGQSLEAYASDVGDELGNALLELAAGKKRGEWLCMKALNRIRTITGSPASSARRSA